MSLSHEIASHLPFLRRYARALAGSQASGDAYVAATLETLAADADSLPKKSNPQVALYALSDHRRLLVKPGITCTWQVGGRSEIDFPGQVKLDVNYIESQSLGQDLKILAKTPKAVVFGPGAY